MHCRQPAKGPTNPLMPTTLPPAQVPLIVSLADDLTGANINASLLSEAGLPSVHVVQRHQLDTGLPPGEAIVVDMECRDVDETESLVRVREATLAVQRALGGRQALWNKRVDSTLRGHISAELAALLGILEPKGTILAPAFPTAGRRTQGGRQLWPQEGSRRVHDLTAAPPMHEDDLLRLMERAGLEVELVTTDSESMERLEQVAELASGSGHVVDASEEGHLRRLALASFEAWRAGALTVCSGPYLGKLAGVGLERGVWRVARPPPILLVIGTRSPVTREQLDYLHLTGVGVVEVSTTDRLPDCATLCRASEIALVAGDYRTSIDADLQRLCTLTERVLEKLDSPGPHSLLISGGRTATTFLRQAGYASLEIQGELLPLISLGLLRGGHLHGSLVATKGGLVGDRGTLAQAIKLLRLFRRQT